MVPRTPRRRPWSRRRWLLPRRRNSPYNGRASHPHRRIRLDNARLRLSHPGPSHLCKSHRPLANRSDEAAVQSRGVCKAAEGAHFCAADGGDFFFLL